MVRVAKLVMVVAEEDDELGQATLIKLFYSMLLVRGSLLWGPSG